MNRIALTATVFAVALGIQLPTWAASSINTTIPMNGVPYSPAPIRSNFGAAANDINALQSKNIGTTPPSNPSPGAWWLDNSAVTSYTLKIWSGRGNAWIPVGVIDTINNVWQPPVGGGLLPTVLSAATTDLGSVPQAALYVAGNSSIQSFGSSAPPGAVKFLVFTGSATLVNTPNVLALPSGADVTQAAGDTAIALQLSQGSWRIVSDSAAAASPATPRTILTSTGNLFVATTGSDASNNCANSISPCQTIQHGCNVAATKYDLGGQLLLINVANGTYSAGCSIAGEFVGTATTSSNPSIEFPATGVQIVGNPSSPGAVIIADTTAPGFTPAVFSAAAGAAYTVSGFTMSSVNGYCLLAEAQALLQFSNVVFGNCSVSQAAAHTNGVIFGIGPYTVAGNAQDSLEAFTGGFVQIGRQPPAFTITLTGTPVFSKAFAVAAQTSRILVNANAVTFSGSASGRRFLAQENSSIDTISGSPTFFPGDLAGALLDFSVYSPYPPLTNISSTGLGSGGTATADVLTGAFYNGGAITLTAGTGASATGTVSFQMPTHQWRACSPSLGNTWNVGSTATLSQNGDQEHYSFTWNNVSPLTASTIYNINYLCTGTAL